MHASLSPGQLAADQKLEADAICEALYAHAARQWAGSVFDTAVETLVVSVATGGGSIDEDEEIVG